MPTMVRRENGIADKYQSEVFTADVIAIAALALSPSSHLRMFYFGSQPQKLMMENGEGKREMRLYVVCPRSKQRQTDSEWKTRSKPPTLGTKRIALHKLHLILLDMKLSEFDTVKGPSKNSHCTGNVWIPHNVSMFH